MDILEQSVRESAYYKNPKTDRLNELKQKKHNIMKELEELMQEYKNNERKEA
jgi:hypothetical protein